MGIYTEAVQKLYVAYFNRPADAAGLTYWETALEKNGGKTADIAAAFAATKEYKDTFAGQSEYQIINTIYKNLFGRDAEPAGLQYWGQGLINKVFTIDAAVTTIAGAAQGTDSVAFKAKVSAATAFTGALDLTPEIIGYSGDVANAAAKVWLAGITNDATMTAATAPAALNATVAVIAVPFVAPMSTTLSAGLDTFVGGAGNDTIFATNTSGTVTLVNGLSAFDNIDGGAGVDTIKFVDLATAPAGQFAMAMGGATVKSVEAINVTTTGGLNLDATLWAGVTDVVASAAGTAAVAVTAGTANVNVQSATTGATTITGGKAVNLSLSAAAGTVGVTGAALTNVTVKGGNVITIDNTSAAAVSATGTTLSTVTLDGIIGGAAVKGASLTNVSLKNIVAANAIVVTNGTAAHSLNITADATGYDTAATPAAVVVSVADAVATSVNVSATSKSNVAVNAGLATKVAVTGSAALTLDVANVAAATSIDASAATGAVTLTGIAAGVTSIVTGSGNDVFTVTAATVKDDTTTAAVETVNATVSTGAGNDTVTLTTTGTGKVTVDTGAGNDKVIVTSRGTEILNISLGDGNDTVSAAPTAAITATDVVDAGAGIDTLALSLVGSANIGAFSNFEVFDTKALAKTLDVDILALKNTVTEIVASGDVGAGSTLTNLGAGVGFRVTGSMAASTQTLTQKVGGALTVTVDADEATTANTTPDTVTASVAATNASSVKAVFDTAFKASIAGEGAAGDNIATLALNTTAATSLEVVSGGALAHNVLAITDLGASGKLAAIVVTGDRDLTINATGTAKLASIDASASTGGLITSTNALLDGGTIKLGSGVDMITVGSTSTSAAVESIVGFEKSAAIAVSVDPADATASAAAKLDADHLMFTAGVAADANAAVTTGTIAKGVLTFTGAGPSDLAAAMGIADLAAETTGEVVVFEYLGNSYVFQQGGAADLAVKLVGVTGVTSLTADAGGVFLV